MNPLTLNWFFRIPNQPAQPLEGMVLVLALVYTGLIVLLSVYGFYALILVLLYWIGEGRKRRHQRPTVPAEWPTVTVQLPIFNEYDMLERLVAAVAAFDYPRDKLEVQVLDDSTDETIERARQLVEQYRERGLNIVHLHRKDRAGFKAGALAYGLKRAHGEFIAVFDADFVPAPDFLRRVTPWFGNPRIACVQSRWTHLNADYSLLTQAQAIVLDGLFVIEQPVCEDVGLFLSFNGSGGIWRREAIASCGGWQADTITEDMDLSYRAQLVGWRIVCLPEVTVPSELPAQMDAWKQQQFRWAKGSLQTLGKLAGPVLRSRLPVLVKITALMHMGAYLVQPFALLLMLLMPFIALLHVPTSSILSIGLLAAVGPQLLYITAQIVQRHGRNARLWALPVVYLIGVGTALSNTLAVLEALRGTPNVFERTPKFGIRSTRDRWTRSRYALVRSPLAWAEAALAVYALVALALGVQYGAYLFVPWLSVYVLGFGIVSGLSFYQDWQRQRRGRPKISPRSVTAR